MAAKERLQGKIGILVLIALVAFIGMMVIGTITLGLGAFLLAGGVMLAFAWIFLNVLRRAYEPRVEDLMLGFKQGNFERGFFGYLRYAFFTFFWSLLFFFPGLVKAIAYSQMFYLMADHKDMGAATAQRESMALMYGHKWEYFVLQLSFIPWFLLVSLTFGIALIYVGPYYSLTMAAYYDRLQAEASRRR